MEQKYNGLSLYFCLEDDMSSLEQFLDLGVRKTFKKGERILPLNKKLDHLYYLKQGKAGRLVTAVNGTEKYIKVVCDQSLIGEVVFFREGVTTDSFVAIEDCECYLFERSIVNSVLLKDEQFIKELIQWFCNRMSSLSYQMQDSLLKDPYYRICKFLLEYVQEFGEISEDGAYIFNGKLSHYDIAKYLGMNRVSVTNVMKQLQEEGIIIKDRTQLVILNAEYLDEL